jgi:hypothetical protein
MHRKYLYAVAFTCGLYALGLATGLDDASAQTTERPWAAGVSSENQEKALSLYGEGNDYFDKARFAEAADKYRDALEHWKHPAIYYNLAVAQHRLNERLSKENNLEVYENIQKALQYGPSALPGGLYEDAQQIARLMEQRIARVDLRCDQPDIYVTLDGAELRTDADEPFTCPGEISKPLQPGPHVIIATRPGYLTETRRIDLFPGTQAGVTFHLRTHAEAQVTKRRWANWKPWAVVGAGVAVGALGGLSHWSSRNSFQSFDREFAQACPAGCRDNEPESPASKLWWPRLQRNAGLGAYALAGAAVTTGLTLVFLNRPQTYRLYEPNMFEEVPVTPMVSSDGFGLTTTFSF